jgi:hypothetical protein
MMFGFDQNAHLIPARSNRFRVAASSASSFFTAGTASWYLRAMTLLERVEWVAGEGGVSEGAEDDAYGRFSPS